MSNQPKDAGRDRPEPRVGEREVPTLPTVEMNLLAAIEEIRGGRYTEALRTLDETLTIALPREHARAALYSTPPQGKAEAVGDELEAVPRVMAESGGWWRSCTGCLDSDDGHPTGHYPYSDIFKCRLGGGCHECGGLGVTWESGRGLEMFDAHAAPTAASEDEVCALLDQAYPDTASGLSTVNREIAALICAPTAADEKGEYTVCDALVSTEPDEREWWVKGPLGGRVATCDDEPSARQVCAALNALTRPEPRVGEREGCQDCPHRKGDITVRDCLYPDCVNGTHAVDYMALHCAAAAIAADRPKEDAAFDAWWESNGQYVSAGGGAYHRRFARAAWFARARVAALRSPTGVTEEMVTAFLEADLPYFTRRSIDKHSIEVCRHTSREVIEPVVVAQYENTPGGQVGADATALRMNTRAALTAALSAKQGGG